MSDERIRQDLQKTSERVVRQRDELRRLKQVQEQLRVENREMSRHALALEGELANALLALDAGDYEEAKRLLVQARADLARAVAGGEGRSFEPNAAMPREELEPPAGI